MPAELVPDAPSNLQASVLSPTSVRLSWDPPSPAAPTPVTGYRVYYYAVTGDAVAEREVSVGGGVTSYTLEGLDKYRAYGFRVVALGANGQGPSSEVSCRTYSDGMAACLRAPLSYIAVIACIAVLVCIAVLAVLLH